MRLLKIYTMGLAVLLTGCASKYDGWEQVRIEKNVGPQCEYTTQQVCYPISAHEGCANFHKKKAAQNSANTVVIDHSNSIGDNGIVADYYFCERR